MGKVALKTSKSSAGVKEEKQLKHTKKQKKKKFWKNHPKIAPMPADAKSVSQLFPSNSSEDFSSNWKALQALLKSTAPAKPQIKVDKKESHKGDPKIKKTTLTINHHGKEDLVTDGKILKATEEVGAADRRPEKRKLQKDGQQTGTADRKLEKRKRQLDGEEAVKVNKRMEQKREKVRAADKRPEKNKQQLDGDKARTADRKPGKSKRQQDDEMTRTADRKKHQREGDETHSMKKPTANNTRETPKIDLWFDDVDPDDIEAALGPEAGQMARKIQGLPEKMVNTVDKVLVKDRAFEGLTRTVAMDCEMVGVGQDGEDSIVARVSMVNQFGKCVYDKYVKPTERVTDYRTEVSGIRPQDIRKGEDFKVVQKEVSEILKGRTLVGHAVHNDLKILFLDHPKKAIRDTQKYKPFRREVKSGRPSLKLLCDKILSVQVQTGEHNSVQDAQAAMRLYTMEKKRWEASIKNKYNKAKSEPQKEKPKLQ